MMDRCYGVRRILGPHETKVAVPVEPVPEGLTLALVSGTIAVSALIARRAMSFVSLLALPLWKDLRDRTQTPGTMPRGT
jgi:hypothetical protein